MAKSIVQNEKQCLICKTTYDLHEHHIFFGTANRRMSEKRGLKVWLCQKHHTGPTGVHFNKDLDNMLKILGQRVYERKVGSRQQFIEDFGRNYL